MKENIGLFLTRRAHLNPGREAVVGIEQGERLTFAELNKRTNRLANALLSRNIDQGDRVAVLLSNQVEYVESYFALAKIGAVLVPLNWRFVPDEVVFVLKDSGATVLLYSSEFDATVEALKQKTDIGTWIRIGERDSRPSVSEDYGCLIQEGSQSEPTIEVEEEDLFLIVYTSGTTGFPKGAMLSHGNMLWACLTWNSTNDMRASDRHLIVLPLFHLGGLFPLSAAFHRGQTVVVMRATDAQGILRVIEGERINIGVIVTTILRRMLFSLESEQYDVSTLRWVVVGGEAVPSVLVERAAKLGVEVLQDYGLTEACGVATIMGSEDAIVKPGSAGKPYFHTQVRVVTEAGQDARSGELGEVIVKGRHVMKGYWNRPDATSEVIRDGWLYTGDAASMDEDGYIYIRDRKKDMIISGGENIYPAEIEQILQHLPQVKEVTVIGQTSVKWGESPVAIVVLKEGAALSAEDVIGYCRGRMAKFKVPRAVEFANELPRNPSGKVEKHILRQQFPGPAPE